MYEGGAGIYVSTRAAGKLEPIVGDPINKRVNSDSYYLGGIDCVLNPGFLQARPTFECAPANESVSEAQINELNDKTIESDLDKRQDQMYDAAAHAKEQPKAAAETKKKYEKALDLAQKEAEKNDKIIDQDDKGHHVHLSVREGQEIEEIKGQINQLAKILEKVVDDVYEQEEPIEEKVVVATKDKMKEVEAEKELKELRKNPDSTLNDYIKHSIKYDDVKLDLDGSQEKQKKRLESKYNNESLADFIKLMADSNISEEAFSEVLDIIKGDLK